VRATNSCKPNTKRTAEHRKHFIETTIKFSNELKVSKATFLTENAPNTKKKGSSTKKKTQKVFKIYSI
jgi:hypothetical protein